MTLPKPKKVKAQTYSLADLVTGIDQHLSNIETDIAMIRETVRQTNIVIRAREEPRKMA